MLAAQLTAMRYLTGCPSFEAGVNFHNLAPLRSIMSVNRLGVDTSLTRSTNPLSAIVISMTFKLLADPSTSAGGGSCGYSILGGFTPSSALV